ncbi:gluconokinase [Pseudovibrio sp. Tun.PSC04-5.I4]|uniref:gluconokinase n=1 Tax=Pseudovibrio sp. Tun.PSC04-5.I4 TaxID=1798213 RepID=UPI00088E6B1C|nr:gluconokinase [Pseudovibrio sp. Tun.PSC04-5.I4]SDR47747.1 gluconokinase [Pseudovibrio sp. Tun.PSC04-5.I4]
MEDNKKSVFVVMGVCGVGKTSVARALAACLPAFYVEADDFHPEDNIEAMGRGHPLTDEMRRPWLNDLSQAIVDLNQQEATPAVVVACSALKRAYRDIIRSYVPHVCFIFLSGEKELIRERMLNRQDHFMPLELLDSQMETLQPPTQDELHMNIDVTGTKTEIINRVLRQIMPEAVA